MKNLLKGFTAGLLAIAFVLSMTFAPISAKASGEKFMVYTMASYTSSSLIVVFDVLDGTSISTDKLAFFSSVGTWTEDSLRSSATTAVVAWANANGYSSATDADVIFTNKPASLKHQETYSGTTSGSGTYTVTFPTAYVVAPNIQANIINATDTQSLRITSVSTTGFTVLARNRTDTLGLLPSYANLNGAAVDVVVTEK